MFDHEKLDVYRVSIEFAVTAHGISAQLKGLNRFTRDQLLRASQSIALNIAEGNGKRSPSDRRRFFEIARGSALECGAILDILTACDAVSTKQSADGKHSLTRIVSMLSRLTDRSQNESPETENGEAT